MRIDDLLRMAFMNLWRRKLRAFLTVLGMIIGVTSIVIMVSLGIGIQKAILDSFANVGSLTQIQVSSFNWIAYEKDIGRPGPNEEKKLDRKVLETFQQIPGVKAVLPIQELYGVLMSGKYVCDANILGIDAEMAEEFGFELGEGILPEPFTGGSNYQIVLGAWTLENFVDPKTWQRALDKDGNPRITTESRIKVTFDASSVYGYQYEGEEPKPPGRIYPVTVVGTMSRDSVEFSWYSLMDINALKKLAKQNKDYVSFDADTYTQAYVKCNSIDDVKSVKKVIEEMGYGTYSPIDAVEMAQEQTRQIQNLLGAIGAVSLLVAAIGIMNTMMMSIYERTKEIGIIKVLGCRMSNIASLFLAEAAFIGLFGGALGLGLSYGVSSVVNFFIQESGFKSIIPVYLAFGGVVFSIVVALISGLYPALRAMRLSPLTAIRNE